MTIVTKRKLILAAATVLVATAAVGTLSLAGGATGAATPPDPRPFPGEGTGTEAQAPLLDRLVRLLTAPSGPLPASRAPRPTSRMDCPG